MTTVNTVTALWALALLAAGVSPAADGTNLLTNAGFESALEPAWERRTPDDGSAHEALKNFPKREEALAALGTHARGVVLTEHPHCWVLSYRAA